MIEAKVYHMKTIVYQNTRFKTLYFKINNQDINLYINLNNVSNLYQQPRVRKTGQQQQFDVLVLRT